MKELKIQDQLYIAPVNGKVKCGKTHNCYTRFGGSQFNMGASNNYPSFVYFAVPNIVFPIDRLEVLYQREFCDYLLPSPKNQKKLTEYINPTHKNITLNTSRDAIESFIKDEKLFVMRLKNEFIMTCVLDKEFVQKVRDNPNKYLEKI
jgi:hypothetical protein